MGSLISCFPKPCPGKKPPEGLGALQGALHFFLKTYQSLGLQVLCLFRVRDGHVGDSHLPAAQVKPKKVFEDPLEEIQPSPQTGVLD